MANEIYNWNLCSPWKHSLDKPCHFFYLTREARILTLLANFGLNT